MHRKREFTVGKYCREGSEVLVEVGLYFYYYYYYYYYDQYAKVWSYGIAGYSRRARWYKGLSEMIVGPSDSCLPSRVAEVFALVRIIVIMIAMSCGLLYIALLLGTSCMSGRASPTPQAVKFRPNLPHDPVWCPYVRSELRTLNFSAATSALANHIVSATNFPLPVANWTSSVTPQYFKGNVVRVLTLLL